MGLDYLCHWFNHFSKQRYLIKADEGDLCYSDGRDVSDRFGGQLYVTGGLLFSSTGAFRAALSTHRQGCARAQVRLHSRELLAAKETARER